MTAEITEIGTYSLQVLSHPSYAAIILLYPKEGSGITGRMYFRRVDATPTVSKSGQITNVYLPEFQYAHSVDVLRNESPVYFHAADDVAYLSTTHEPVGELEP